MARKAAELKFQMRLEKEQQKEMAKKVKEVRCEYLKVISGRPTLLFFSQTVVASSTQQSFMTC